MTAPLGLALGLWLAAGPGGPAGPAAAAAPFAVEVVAGEADQPRLLLAPRPGQLATLRIGFAVGAFDDGDVPGLTRLAQQALLEANEALAWRPYALALHAAAAHVEVVTGQRECAFVLTADRRDFALLARQLTAALLGARFDFSRLRVARERTALLGGVDTGLVGVVTAVAGEDGRYLNPVVGRAEELEAITPRQVRDHLARYFAPANATVVATGAFEPAEVRRAVRAFRGGRAEATPRLELPRPFQTRRLYARDVHLLALPVRLETAEQAAAARVLVELADEALWRAFRERGAAYAHDASVVREPWLDLLLITLPGGEGTGLDVPARVQEVVAGLGSRLATGPDLERARAAAEGALAAVDREPEGLARALSRGGAAWHGPAVAEAIRAMPRDRIEALARAWLDPSNTMYFYLGPAE